MRLPQLNGKLERALQQDSISLFELELTLSGKPLQISLLRWILKKHAYQILDHLLRNRLKALSAILAPQDLLICLCMHPQGNGALMRLDTLEELFPGISRSTDSLGNNPLWYCLYRHKASSTELAQALLRNGCDPDQRNHLNLSYRLCRWAENLFGIRY